MGSEYEIKQRTDGGEDAWSPITEEDAFSIVKGSGVPNEMERLLRGEEVNLPNGPVIRKKHGSNRQ